MGVPRWLAVYYGGDFTAVDGRPGPPRSLRHHDQRAVDHVQARVGSRVGAIATIGSTVYVGGFLRSANGQARNFLAAFDASRTATPCRGPPQRRAP